MPGKVEVVHPVLRIQLLGSFLLQWEEQPLRGMSSTRLQALLASLLLNRQAPLARRQIAFHFWPDSSEVQAFANLRNLLTQLRRALPAADTYLYIDSTSVQWNSGTPYWFDVEEFEAALAQGSLELAVSLYQGDLLPDCYDEWIHPERERLRQSYSRVLETLLQEKEAGRDYPAAVRYGMAYLQQDPLNETTYTRLMHLHALLGDRSEALRVYHQCVLTLQSELGVEPGPAIQKSYQQLMRFHEQHETAGARKKEPLLVGRDNAWRHLLQSWQAAAAGQPRLTVLLGEAGIGKTRLLEEFREWAVRQGITTTYARSYSAQGRLAYAPVTSWLRSSHFKGKLGELDAVWLSEITRILPELSAQHPDLTHSGPIKEGWQRRCLFEALARAVFTAHQPLLLILDDIQWADQETLAWLSYLIRFDPGAGMLILGGARPEEPAADQVLAALRLDLQREGLMTEFELAPLDLSETVELVDSICERDCSCEDIEKIFQETEGNPLFIVETVRSRAEMVGSGKSRDTVGVFSRSFRINGKMDAVIGSRLSQLGGPAQALAALASAIGRQFQLNVLSEAWKSSEEELVEGLDELWRRRIVREQGENGYDFSHDKIRETVYLRLNQAHRRLLHRTLAQALEKVYANEIEAASVEIANHYLAAGSGRLALPYFLNAGELAMRLYANEEAISHLRSGLAIITAAPPGAYQEQGEVEVIFRLLNVFGDILAHIGERQEARQMYAHIFEYCSNLDPLRRAQAHRKIGQAWMADQGYEQVLQTCDAGERALESLLLESGAQAHAGDLPEVQQEWLNILLNRMWVYYYLGEPDKIREFERTVFPGVRDRISPNQRASFYSCLVGMGLRQERYIPSSETLSYLRLGQEAAHQSGDESLMAFSCFELGFTYLWAGELAQAEAFLLEGKERAEKIGDEQIQVLCWTYLCVLLRKMGRVESARQSIPHSLEIAARSQRTLYIAMAQANQAWLSWLDGDSAQTETLGTAALEIWNQAPTRYPFLWAALYPLLGAASSGDNLEQAVQYAARLLEHDLQPPPLRLAEQLETCKQGWEAGRVEFTRRALEEVIRLAGEYGYL
jgi:DNA-binding SARP family transcriptional activator